MIKENRSKLFVDTILYICKQENIKVPIVYPYKLRFYSAWCSYNTRLQNRTIAYMPEIMDEWTISMIIELACHELGHVKYVVNDRTKSEYLAQLFALKCMHNYFPKQFSYGLTNQAIKMNARWYGDAYKQARKEFKIWKNTP